MITRPPAKKPNAIPVARTVRVAIYTRKSVADRNGQEFGSIDAQRETVEAYVLSQRCSGWIALPFQYDDEGFSGGTTRRPAFERLLEDVREQRVDVVAVHRIDRLSRSLADFTQLMRLFDEHGVAFVATSQQFDTSTSMGKLTLNILASFAQFEREMIAERTADKMLATRRRGKWTGGPVPLGYDVRDKRLVVNEDEARVVREAFTRFLKTKSIVGVLEWLTEHGHRTKRDKPFDRGTLVRILKSPIYAGRIQAGDDVVDGEHDAIVDFEILEQAQAILEGNKRKKSQKRSSESLLAGILRCGRCGASMSPSHTRKGNRRYSYYKCQTVERRGASACPGGSISGPGIEDVVIDRIKAIGQDPELIEATIAAAKERLAQERAESDRRLAGLLARQEDLQNRRRTALERLTGNGGDRTTHEAIGVFTAELDQVETEIREAQTRADALACAQVREDEIRSGLTSFSEVWDELFPREQRRVVRQLIEQVEYGPETDEVEIRFRPEGFGLIAGRKGS